MQLTTVVCSFVDSADVKFSDLATNTLTADGISWPVTRKPDPPFLVPPGPNISKYLDPPDNLFQFC